MFHLAPMALTHKMGGHRADDLSIGHSDCFSQCVRPGHRLPSLTYSTLQALGAPRREAPAASETPGDSRAACGAMKAPMPNAVPQAERGDAQAEVQLALTPGSLYGAMHHSCGLVNVLFVMESLGSFERTVVFILCLLLYFSSCKEF